MPSVKKSMPRYLTLEESLELLTHIESSNYERDFCIVTLFLNCGMRLSELVGINCNDIRENTISLLGKGIKERIIYLIVLSKCNISLFRRSNTANNEKYGTHSSFRHVEPNNA